MALAFTPRLVPRWGLYLLVSAAAWTLLLSTALQIVDPGVAGWSPVHAQRSLGQSVPFHTHAHDLEATDGASCDGTGGVVCAMGDDAGINTASLHAGSGPAGALHASAVAVASISPAARSLLGVTASPVTPPPRG